MSDVNLQEVRQRLEAATPEAIRGLLRDMISAQDDVTHCNETRNHGEEMVRAQRSRDAARDKVLANFVSLLDAFDALSKERDALERWSEDLKAEMLKHLCDAERLSRESSSIKTQLEEARAQIGHERREADERTSQLVAIERARYRGLEAQNASLLKALADYDIMRPMVIQVAGPDSTPQECEPRVGCWIHDTFDGDCWLCRHDGLRGKSLGEANEDHRATIERNKRAIRLISQWLAFEDRPAIGTLDTEALVGVVAQLGEEIAACNTLIALESPDTHTKRFQRGEDHEHQ